MNSEMKYAVQVTLIVTSVTFGIGLGMTFLFDYMAHQDVRTHAECNQLVGTMKDDPINDKDFLQMYPEKANELRKDNCNQGLDKIDLMALAIKIILLPGLTILTSVMVFQMLKPTKPSPITFGENGPPMRGENN